MKKYILLLIGLTLMTSCSDFIEHEPQSSVNSEDAFNNLNDFENALNGVYFEQVASGGYYGGMLQGFDVMTDNLLISRAGLFSQERRHDWTYDSNSGFSGYLANCYKVIYDANSILQNLSKLEDSPEKDNIKGQALGARALAHFDIVRYFGQTPKQSDDAEETWAMPYVFTADITNTPARIRVDTYYGLIVDDLMEAETLISDSNGVYQLGKDAINTILARTYLYMEEWQKAIDAANEVLTPVAERSQFVGVWNDSNEDGVIFKLRNDDTSDITLGSVFNQTTANGIRDEYVPDFAFYSQYLDTDIRKTAYFLTSDFSGTRYNHIIKWYSSVSTQALGVVDAKVLRAAEVYLTKAEAQAELNFDGQALSSLDEVRSRRYNNFISGGETGNTLKDAIQRERRLELAFEGMRFSDIKRKRESIVRSDFGDEFDGSGTSATVKTLDATSYKFQTPIPIEEISINGNMRQNPGYGN